MALLSRTNVNLRDTSKNVTVPNDPKAKLMYYLDCICSVLKMDDNPDINRFRNYGNYYTLSQSDTNVLLSLCILLKPELLINKCIFQNDRLCGDGGNKFFELEAVKQNLLVAGSVLIGGQNKQVTNIMAFKESWLRNNWLDPIKILLERQAQEKAALLERLEREAALERQKTEAALERQERVAALERQKREAALERQKAETALKRQEREAALERQKREDALRKREAAVNKQKREDALRTRQREDALRKREDALKKREDELRRKQTSKTCVIL